MNGLEAFTKLYEGEILYNETLKLKYRISAKTKKLEYKSKESGEWEPTILSVNDLLDAEWKEVKILAVSWTDYDKYGCVHCGCDYCYSGNFSGGGSTPVTCGECEGGFVILADGLEESRVGFGDGKGGFEHPKRIDHPRKGTPKHEYVRPDIRPEGEGEFFRPRGIGYDLAGFVKSKQAGERIIQMFKEVLGKDEVETWLDYRKNEPTWIQVKIQGEEVDLETIQKLTKEDGIITKLKIEQALAVLKGREDKNGKA